MHPVDNMRMRREHMAIEAPEPDGVVPRIPATWETFKEDVRAVNQRHVNYHTDCCDWVFGEQRLFHERHTMPWNFTASSFSNYWSETTYTDLKLATRDAEHYGAQVEKEWYCDDANPSWFLIFHYDLDKALRHAFDMLKKEGKL